MVNGHYAWDEDIPGAEIVAGKGNATPMPDAVDERLIRLWASPQGAPKAAIKGVAPDSADLAPTPARCSRTESIRRAQTSLTVGGWQASRDVSDPRCSRRDRDRYFE